MKLCELYEKLEELQNEPNVEFGILGTSTLGLPIYLAHIGNKDKDQIIVEASIHAREYVTALVAFEQVKHLAKMSLEFGIYFVLCANPDGVGLVLEGKNFALLNEKRKSCLVEINKGNDFSHWKANINGVDCNVNFDALWGKGKSNVKKCGSANYIGTHPNSEIEVKNLIDLTKQIGPVLTLSYHTKGNVVYYGFEVLAKEQIKRDLLLAKAIAKTNGFKTVKTVKSTGGYSDYVSFCFGVPALTIEFGEDKLNHPISEKFLEVLTKNNLELPLICYKALADYNKQMR